MRDIQFRAWDKKQEKMLYDFGVEYSRSKEEIDREPNGFWSLTRHSDRASLSVPEEAIILEYTGLKDKNNKEIYEGDIITLDSPSLGKINNLIISFIRSAFWIVKKPEIGYWFCHLDEHFNQCIVTGNIYENPELLKEEIKKNKKVYMI